MGDFLGGELRKLADSEKRLQMRGTIPPQKASGFTRTELLVVVAVFFLLALVLVGWRIQEQPKTRARVCVENLKQIGMAFRMWSSDSGDDYPMGVSTNRGGSMEYVLTGGTFRHFLTMTNELQNSRILACPEDNRLPAASFAAGLANTNISYFVGMDADQARPDMLLSGDRTITNSAPQSTRLLKITTNDPAGWSRSVHLVGGNIALSDGSGLGGIDVTGLRRQIADGERAFRGPMRLSMPVP